MWKKLELDVKLCNGKHKILGANITTTVYQVKIKVLNKDYRFDCSEYGNKEIQYNSSYNFFISVNPCYPDGNLLYYGIILPITELSSEQEELNITFYTEENRRNYLKRLNASLIDWNKKWIGFYDDSGNEFKFNGSKWVYACSVAGTEI